jgi:hypothetical protein
VNRLDRALERAVRDMTRGPRRRPPRTRPEMPEPGERATIPRRMLAVTYALAVILPTATAALLIPFRADHPQATAIVLVVPVVLVAARGATGPALVAAGVAGLAYDVLLTAPYYQLVIDDPDDIVAALTLVTVAAVVGLLSSQLVHISARDAARRDELAHLLAFVQRASRDTGPTELEDAANQHIAELLGLRECRWHARFRGGGGAILHPDGSVSGHVTALNADRATLPRDVELPAFAHGEQLGCFLLTPREGHATSHEERLTAATIAQVYATTTADRASSRAAENHPESTQPQ